MVSTYGSCGFHQVGIKVSLHECCLKQLDMWLFGRREHLVCSLASKCEHFFKNSRLGTSIPLGLQFGDDPASLRQLRFLEANKDLQNELVGFSGKNCFLPHSVLQGLFHLPSFSSALFVLQIIIFRRLQQRQLMLT